MTCSGGNFCEPHNKNTDTSGGHSLTCGQHRTEQAQRLELTIELINDCNSQLSTAQARRQKKLQYSTRPADNVALTTKGLQEKSTTIELDDSGKIGNKGPLINYVRMILAIFDPLYPT